MNTQIRANLKQVTVKGVETTVQFTVATGANGFNDLVRMAGQDGSLYFESDQQEIPGVTINRYHVDGGTGEITEE